MCPTLRWSGIQAAQRRRWLAPGSSWCLGDYATALPQPAGHPVRAAQWDRANRGTAVRTVTAGHPIRTLLRTVRPRLGALLLLAASPDLRSVSERRTVLAGSCPFAGQPRYPADQRRRRRSSRLLARWPADRSSTWRLKYLRRCQLVELKVLVGISRSQVRGLVFVPNQEPRTEIVVELGRPNAPTTSMSPSASTSVASRA